MKNRIEAIDIAKGLGIILVVFGHLTNAGEWQRILVHSFHMPLFMILSGYCFHDESVNHIVTKAAKRYLMIAYATLAIDIPISLVFARQPFPDAWGWLKTFTLSGGLWRNTPIWFLFTLTLCQILMALCLKFPKEVRYFVVGAFVLLNMLLSFQIGWWVTATLSAFPFFAFGCCAASKNALHNVKKWGGQSKRRATAAIRNCCSWKRLHRYVLTCFREILSCVYVYRHPWNAVNVAICGCNRQISSIQISVLAARN